MTEQSKITAAGVEEKPGTARTSTPSVPWGPDFATSEHPDTARHRIQREYIMAVTDLPRSNLERKYGYLQQLIARAKEELGHARSANNEHRMAAMQQNIDELVAYVAGYGIRANLPNRNGENGSAAIASFYVLEEIPTFLGELSFLIDRWYEEELAGIHDELLKLTGLAARLR